MHDCSGKRVYDDILDKMVRQNLRTQPMATEENFPKVHLFRYSNNFSNRPQTNQQLHKSFAVDRRNVDHCRV